MFPMKSFCIGPSSFLIRSPKSIRVEIGGKSRFIEVSKVGIGPTESNRFSLARSNYFSVKWLAVQSGGFAERRKDLEDRGVGGDRNPSFCEFRFSYRQGNHEDHSADCGRQLRR